MEEEKRRGRTILVLLSVVYLRRTWYWLDQNMNKDAWPDLRHLQQVFKEYSISS